LSNVYNMLPKLIVNRQFIHDFFEESSPCCAIGVIKDRKKELGLLAIKPSEFIPDEVTNQGFRFGNSLYGSSGFEVIHFSFEFYGFKAYNVLINPNNKISRLVLNMMIESKEYFIIVLNPNNNVVAFKSEIAGDILFGLRDNLLKINSSTTSDFEYMDAFLSFSKNTNPVGEMLNWVCYDKDEYLDIERDILDLNPDRST
jgi:hypothetical protein